VDELGGLKKALDLAKERAGFAPDARVELRVLPEKKPFFQYLLSNLAAESVPGLALLDARDFLSRSPMLRLASEGRPLALMPFQLQIH
jgi:hypothetical protein